MNKKINKALISVFYKDGLEPIVKKLIELGVEIFSTGGTQTFIENLGLPCTSVESLTSYPSILGGRVKTLHPKVFGAILGRSKNEQDLKEMKEFDIPSFDLVIVDLYPFEETVATTTDEKLIIEKIDVGGPSMIRGAAKNHNDVLVIASKDQYQSFLEVLEKQNGETSLAQRIEHAKLAFKVTAQYDMAIANWFMGTPTQNIFIQAFNGKENSLRYGENPHQAAKFYGKLNDNFEQMHGKEISYNNLVDIDAAIELINEFEETTFGIIKHTNTCGIASRNILLDAWNTALAGDPESAFGGVLVCNASIDEATANAINEIFFEVLIANDFEPKALEILQSKKNRILLKRNLPNTSPRIVTKKVLNGILIQETDEGNYNTWSEVGGRNTSPEEQEDLKFANIVCKHLKSNAIAIIKNKQLIGKGCGQTSRIDALKYAIEKAVQFNFDTTNAVLSSDAFFPFDDCVKIAHKAGITCFIQPGGSIRDTDSINYCKENNLAMVITGMRHFKH